MTSVAAPTRWAADQWENHCGYSSAVLSGIAPDARHKDNGGYHCSINDLAAYGNLGDYSNRRKLDKAPPVTSRGKDNACAIDMSVSKADMIKMYRRVKAVFDDRSDTRRRYINAINVWDGVAGHAPRRLDFQANTNTAASWDHTWHGHGDQPRAYVDVHRSEAEAWTAARALVSMLKGETHAQWLASNGEDDLPMDQATFDKLLANALKPGSPARIAIGAAAHQQTVFRTGESAHAWWFGKIPESIIEVNKKLDVLAANVGGNVAQQVAAIREEMRAVREEAARRDAEERARDEVNAQAAAERDAKLAELVERIDSGAATAGEIAEELRALVHAATAPAQG